MSGGGSVEDSGGAGAGAPVRVLVVDDDPLVRSALAVVLGGLDDVTVVGEGGDGEQAVALAAATAPDVVLLDVRMPRRDGISAAREITARQGAAGAGPRVVVLTTFGDDEAVLAALRAGADGFLLKDTPPADIVVAVRRAAAGEPVLSPDVVRRLIGRATAPAPAADADRRQRARHLLERLGDKERRVAVAVGQGLPNAEIGARLSMSTATVKAYVSRVMDRLEVDNRVQVAIVVHDAGLA
ncbi:response regulator [Kineococcus auxinigenes]|uniref:response regulator n=1 Tax=unclassified Kineococcus TaxID=2621656 RepID=UPI003D7E36C0